MKTYRSRLERLEYAVTVEALKTLIARAGQCGHHPDVAAALKDLRDLSPPFTVNEYHSRLRRLFAALAAAEATDGGRR
jgi:hypothetical protein